MKEIFNVVITGGPCAGKTTALEKITEELNSRGYSVVICEETATYFIKAGLRPFGDDKDRLKLMDFQRMILRGQLAKEKLCQEGAEMMPNDKVVILYDRGALDNRAYLEDYEFDELMLEEGVTEEELLSRYDLVIHLVSTAVDKEKCYVTSTVRIEPPEQARYLDYKTARTWRNHTNHKVIFNDCEIDEKVQIAINEILTQLENLKEQKVYQKAM